MTSARCCVDAIAGMDFQETSGSPPPEPGGPAPSEDEAASIRSMSEPNGLSPQSLAVGASSRSTTGAPSYVQEGNSSDQQDRSSSTLFSTASIVPPRPTSPPVVLSDAVHASNTVDPQQVRELALVFPQESDAELKRVLLASGGDFEAAAGVLLEKPLQVRTGRFRQSGWGPGLADVVRGSGMQLDLGRVSSSSSANVDVIEGAMAIMSAAMVPCPPTVHEQTAPTSRAAETITEIGLASEPASPADSSSSLMEQLVALPVPTDALPTVPSTTAAAGRKSTRARGRAHEAIELRGAVDAPVSMPMPAE